MCGTQEICAMHSMCDQTCDFCLECFISPLVVATLFVFLRSTSGLKLKQPNGGKRSNSSRSKRHSVKQHAPQTLNLAHLRNLPKVGWSGCDKLRMQLPMLPVPSVQAECGCFRARQMCKRR